MLLKRASVVVISAVLTLSLGACGVDYKAQSTQTVTIGVIAPLDAGLTQFGRGIRNSVELAVDEANQAGLIPGFTLDVEAVDDSSDPAVGERNARRLVDDPSVVGVVGTYNSGVAAVVAPQLEQADIAMISPGNTNPTLTIGPNRNAPQRQFDNYFRMVAHDAQQGGFLAAYAREDLHTLRAAVITDAKPVSQGLANDFRAAFERAGGSIVSFEVVPDGDVGYGPYAARAAAAQPELLFFGGEYDHAALLKQAAVGAGLTVPLMGGDGIQADDYIAAAGALAEGDLASSVGAPIEQEPRGGVFLAAYDAQGFAAAPSNFGPYAYDAANILISAARRALQGKTAVDAEVRAAVIAAVQSITSAALDFKGGAVTGAIGFNQFGDTVNPVLTVYRVEGGVWKPLVTRQFEG